MAKYRIVLDSQKCMGDGSCVDLAPETFSLDDEDRSFVTDEGGNWPEYVLKAAKACPTDAITLFDADTGDQVWPVPGSKEDLRRRQ